AVQGERGGGRGLLYRKAGARPVGAWTELKERRGAEGRARQIRARRLAQGPRAGSDVTGRAGETPVAL
ncbi:MAG: hypothetical protein AAF074_25635, partial [Pseudomonadota bacterium]